MGSRVRRADLRHFTVDRLMTVLAELGYEVAIDVAVGPPETAAAQPAPGPR